MAKNKGSTGVLFNGLVHVSGELGVGKTMFALSCGAMPEDMAFIDDDMKGEDVVNQLTDQGRSFGFYCNLITLGSGLKELAFHDACLGMISDLEKKVVERGSKFDALVWDTWARFENTFHPYVATYPNKFKQYWSPMGVIKGAEQWNEAFRYESEVINRLQQVAKLVILTSHLKPENIAGRKTGKNVPDVKKPVTQKCLLRVYLRHNPDSPEPIGLILKRPSRQVVSANGIDIVSILPRRMKPFTWSEIRKYWNEPIGNRPLNSSETPDAFELSILDGVLTIDQKEIMRLYDTAPVLSDDDTETVFSDDTILEVKNLKAAGTPIPMIAKKAGISISGVNSILHKDENESKTE